jgi:hypothetical protein
MVQVNLNMISGIFFHLIVNRSVTIQLAKLIHNSWAVGVSVGQIIVLGFEG